MASRSQAVEFVSDELERTAGLARASARGAVRGALAQALFDPRHVTTSQLRAVVERLLPSEIRGCGVKDADAICQRLAAQLASGGFGASDPESPDEVFSRLIRR
jgi:hypothetical protein